MSLKRCRGNCKIDRRKGNPIADPMGEREVKGWWKNRLGRLERKITETLWSLGSLGGLGVKGDQGWGGKIGEGEGRVQPDF